MSGDNAVQILFLNHWAQTMGGAEHSLLDLLEEAASHCAVALLTAEEGVLLERARTLGIPCTVVPCSRALGNVRRGRLLRNALRQWRSLFSFARFVLGVRRYVVRANPALIHANVPKSHVTLFFLRALGYRGVCCFHVREIFEPQSLPYRLYGLLYRQRTSFVIAISRAVRHSLPQNMAAGATVIYNGVSIGPPRTYSGIGTKPLRFVYLGRVVPWKGCHLLIKAFVRLYARYGDRTGTLDLVGGTLYWDQSYRDELQALIVNRGIEGVCRLLPHTPTPIETLGSYDVFCIASTKEPFGRVVAEAQGCGLPVIGFDDGGIGEIVEQERTGMLVRAGDTEGFVHAMARFIDEPSLVASMGAAARARAAALFDRMVQRRTIVDVLRARSSGAGQKQAARP